MVPRGQKAEVGRMGECNFVLLLMGTVIHFKLVLPLNSYKCHQLSWVFHKKMLASEKKTMERKDLSKCGKKSDRPFPASAIV